MGEVNQLDLSLLQGYLDNLGKDIVQQMLELYTQQSKLYLIDIESNILAEEQSLWQGACHKMKGAAGSVGLLAVHKTLVDIEQSTASADEKSAFIKALITLNNRAINAFKHWLLDT
ncbi:MAG: HPt (histidine-containing phosphotransfer) domain-containing protein [Alteromonadaceae bacterium]